MDGRLGGATLLAAGAATAVALAGRGRVALWLRGTGIRLGVMAVAGVAGMGRCTDCARGTAGFGSCTGVAKREGAYGTQ